MSEIKELQGQLEFDTLILKKHEEHIDALFSESKPLKTVIEELYRYIKLSHNINVNLNKLNALKAKEETEFSFLTVETIENVSTMVLPLILERLEDF